MPTTPDNRDIDDHTDSPPDSPRPDPEEEYPNDVRELFYCDHGDEEGYENEGKEIGCD
jgi:hypothetical protein